MALLKYDKQNFVAALEPGISVLVVSAFEKRLEEKLNGIVQEVYDELKRELPDEIKSRITRVIDVCSATDCVNVEVELKTPNNQVQRDSACGGSAGTPGSASPEE